MYGKYSVFNMMKLYRDNKPVIHAYLKGQSVEGYSHLNHTNDSDADAAVSAGAFAAFGGIAIFLVLMAINMAIWIWALIWTMKYWKVLPGWAQALSVIGLLGVVGGPIMTLIVVYIGKNSNGAEKISKFKFGGCGSW
jgi:hypothetical protein